MDWVGSAPVLEPYHSRTEVLGRLAVHSIGAKPVPLEDGVQEEGIELVGMSCSWSRPRIHFSENAKFDFLRYRKNYKNANVGSGVR